MMNEELKKIYRIFHLTAAMLNDAKLTGSMNTIDLDSYIKSGYSPAEISAAFDWILDKKLLDNAWEDSLNSKNSSSVGSFRILSEQEKRCFSPEAWGKVLELIEIGAMTKTMLEELIDSASFGSVSELSDYDVNSYVVHRLMQSDFTFLAKVMFHNSNAIH